ncbi:uncharacterized protein LOC134552043 [Prinia subflava]|uniref:uncharacterized protein LOC134552043 n=1 Tax=Prinia subflava TaxID=208062 RepID=UPI002FE05B15
MLLPSLGRRSLLQSPVAPSRVPMEPWPSKAVGWHRSSPDSSRPSAPSRARQQRLLAGPQGCAGRGGRGWAQREPGRGAEPAPTLPSCRSLQLEGDRSRAAEHLRRALPYLENPQQPLRAAAIRFLGIAGRRLRGQQEELQLISKAIECLTEDISGAVSDLAYETLYMLQATQSGRYSVFQRLQDQLRRAWRTRPRLSGLSWLRCRGSAER